MSNAKLIGNRLKLSGRANLSKTPLDFTKTLTRIFGRKTNFVTNGLRVVISGLGRVMTRSAQFPQRLLKSVAIVSRERELGAVVEDDVVFAMKPRL